MRIEDLNLAPEERAELEAWGEQMAAKAVTEEYTERMRPSSPGGSSSQAYLPDGSGREGGS